MKLECPYCKDELVKGFINSGRFSMKWHDTDVAMLEKAATFGGEVLSNKTLVKCYRCRNCSKIIINLDEL